MRQPRPEPDFWTTTQVAELCAVSQATILRAIAGGQLKAATTPGGHFRVSERDLQDFLRANNIEPPASLKRRERLLIVEDNPAELRVFLRALAEQDLEIQATASGFETGLLVRSFKPDIILLDILIPDIDGRQIARLIRSDPELRSIRIAAITGSSDEKLLREIKDCGIDDLILKPVSPAELRRRIKLLA